MSNDLLNCGKDECIDSRSNISKAKSSDSLFSISSIDSCSRSYDSLVDIIGEQKETRDNKFEVKSSGWIPICDKKRRVRDQIVGETLSKSPQVKDAIKLLTSLRISPLGRRFGSDSNLNYYADSK